MLRLNCWVLGQDPLRIFQVKIDGKETASILKKMIKAENEHALHRNLKENLNNLELPDKDELLPLQLLKLFSHPPDEDHHLIARTLEPSFYIFSFLVSTCSH
ncbi:hypothetical protein F5148DRAFT_159304 [Russula earlei]|uniref:Uncharacterized protein n=1 Tax=Russula earlei TaxID=71964 RepID=A0ACC0U6Y4_9AGAM|nr:hypothetical protein F5148DRAFT_159304 [Russula earlei]